MRTQVTHAFPETALERILDALEHELVASSDADILEAADDLGMKPQMKGSAAFAGLRYSSAMRSEDFFDAKWMQQVLSDPRRIWLASAALSAGKPQPSVAASRASSRARPARKKSPRPPKEPREG